MIESGIARVYIGTVPPSLVEMHMVGVNMQSSVLLEYCTIGHTLIAAVPLLLVSSFDEDTQPLSRKCAALG